MLKRAVVHNISLLINLPINEDANSVAASVIASINNVLRQANFGFVEPVIISTKHPVSMVIDQDCDANPLGLKGP